MDLMNLQPVQAIEHQKNDVQIRTIDGSSPCITAHKDILIKASPALQALCSQSNNIHIPDFSAEVVSVFLAYLHNPTEQVLECHKISLLLQLHSFSLKYQVKKLREDIIFVLGKYQVSQTSIFEVVRVLEDGTNNEEVCFVLQHSVEKFIAENLKPAEELAKVFTTNLNSSGVLNIPFRKIFKDGKKTVRFSDLVQRQIFNTNSAILSNTAKNKRKAAKKRKALERKISEMEVSSVEESTLDNKANPIADITIESLDDSSNDSGLASSLEESISLNFDEEVAEDINGWKNDSLLKISNEFIFDLDI